MSYAGHQSPHVDEIFCFLIFVAVIQMRENDI